MPWLSEVQPFLSSGVRAISNLGVLVWKSLSLDFGDILYNPAHTLRHLVFLLWSLAPLPSLQRSFCSSSRDEMCGLLQDFAAASFMALA